MNRRMIVLTLLLCGASVGLSVGCSSGTMDPDTKRAQDRVAMQLSDAQTQRDQLKTQLDKAQAELAEERKNSTDNSQELVLLRKQVQDLQTANTALNSDNEKLKTDLSRANVAKTAETK